MIPRKRGYQPRVLRPYPIGSSDEDIIDSLGRFVGRMAETEISHSALAGLIASAA